MSAKRTGKRTLLRVEMKVELFARPLITRLHGYLKIRLLSNKVLPIHSINYLRLLSCFVPLETAIPQLSQP